MLGNSKVLDQRDDKCGTTRWKAAKAVSKTMAHLDETGLEVEEVGSAVKTCDIGHTYTKIHTRAHTSTPDQYPGPIRSIALAASASSDAPLSSESELHPEFYPELHWRWP